MSRRSQLPGPVPKSTDRQAWETALAEHFAREYEANPLPTFEQLSLLEKFQGAQTGITNAAWLNRYGPNLLQEREILRESLHVESEPIIVLLSNLPGLAAAHTVFKENRPPFIFYLSPASFDSFLAEHPDETQRWHVTYLGSVTDELPPEVLRLARKKYKLRKSEQYWVHFEVSSLAPLFVRGCIHLWKWNGQKQTLLEEAFYTWIS